MTILASLIPQPSQVANRGSLLLGLPLFLSIILLTTRCWTYERAKPQYIVPYSMAFVKAECQFDIVDGSMLQFSLFLLAFLLN